MISTKKTREAQVSIKLDQDTKDKANALFNHLGLSMSSAIKMFISQPTPD